MMQDGDSTSDAFPGNFYLDYGSNAINLGWYHNNVVPTDPFVLDGHPVMGSMGQSSSSMNNETHVRFQDLLAEDGLSSHGMEQPTTGVNTQTQLRFQDLLAGDGLSSNGVDQSSIGVNAQTPVGFQGLLAGDGLSSHGMDQSTTGVNAQTLVRFQDLLVEDWLSSNGIDQSATGVNAQTPVRYQYLLPEDGLLSNGVDQSTTGVNAQTPVRFQDLLAEDGLLSSPVASDGTDQSLAAKHSGPLIAPFHLSVNMNPGNGQLTDRSFPLQQASSSVFPQNIDLNASFDNQNTDAGLNTVTVEENNHGEGHSPDGRLLSCKRRAPEDAFGQLSVGESSNSTQQVITNQENASSGLNLPTPIHNHPDVKYSEQLGAGVMVASGTAPVMCQPSNFAGSGLVAGAGASSDIHQTIGVVAEAEDSQRNVRLRTTVNHQDIVPTNFATLTTINSHPQSAQPAALFSFDYVPNTSSGTAIVQPTTPMWQPLHLSSASENVQPFQWNAVTWSRNLLPSISVDAVNGGDASLLRDHSRNNQRNNMLPSEFLRGNSEHMLRNLNFVSGTNSSGNIAYSLRNNSTSHVHGSSAPIRFLPDNMALQYAQRTSNIVNYTESQGQHTYRSEYVGIPAAARGRESSMRGSNARPSNTQHRSGLAIRTEGPSGPHPEVDWHFLTAAQRGDGLGSELYNSLALVRPGGSLQFGDVMMIDGWVVYGGPEEPDQHEDMRLDVDNMSYEELLALEEQIGNVSTGLSEDAILAQVKCKKYEAIVVGSPVEVEPCCICQEDYADGEELGKLDCGHEFHLSCIKQWLVQKNNCPICKMAALKV